MGIRDGFYSHRRLRGLINHRKKLERKLSSLNWEYKNLVEECQPKINELSSQADALALKFKSLFQQSQDSFAIGDKSAANRFSAQGKESQKECESRNAAVNEMRFRLKNLFNQISISNKEIEGVGTEINFWLEQKEKRGSFWKNFLKRLKSI